MTCRTHARFKRGAAPLHRVHACVLTAAMLLVSCDVGGATRTSSSPKPSLGGAPIIISPYTPPADWRRHYSASHRLRLAFPADWQLETETTEGKPFIYLRYPPPGRDGLVIDIFSGGTYQGYDARGNSSVSTFPSFVAERDSEFGGGENRVRTSHPILLGSIVGYLMEQRYAKEAPEGFAAEGGWCGLCTQRYYYFDWLPLGEVLIVGISSTKSWPTLGPTVEKIIATFERV